MKTAPELNFVYDATVHKIIDGDTLDMLVDLGFRVYTSVRARIRGIDVYEHTTTKGQEAIQWLLVEVGKAKLITIQSYKDQHSFERWICDVWLDGELLADKLREAGYAKETNPHTG